MELTVQLPDDVAQRLSESGGDLSRRALEALIADAVRGDLPALTFLDLDHDAVDRERDRMAKTRRSGPSAENLLRDRGALSSSYPRSES